MNKELKRLAQNARNRLISKGENGGMKKVSAPLSPNVKFKVLSSDADEMFNLKALDVLERGCLNPINELMDLNYYSSLSAGGKQRYLLEVVDKLNRVREKFERNAAAL